MTPTADHVAAAIVAACRETGDDALACAGRELGTFRARHYAMWALLHVFPLTRPTDAVVFVGVPNPGGFYNRSRSVQLRSQRPGGGGWWDGETYARVIAAIEAVPAAEPPKAAQNPEYSDNAET